MSQKQLDVLSVGDVVTDAFIKLLDDQQKIEYGKDYQSYDHAHISTMSFLILEYLVFIHF